MVYEISEDSQEGSEELKGLKRVQNHVYSKVL